jgi:hypothetical protein
MSTNQVTGSKASSPAEQKSQIDFQFLNFSHPSEAKASRARKTVRSHVTRQQHQREHAAAAARRAKSFPQPEDERELDEHPPLRTHAATFPANRPTLELPSGPSQSISSPEASSQSPSPIGSPSYPFERGIDPKELYPLEWHPYIPRVIVCWSVVMYFGPKTKLCSGLLSLKHGCRCSRCGWTKR